MTTTPKNGGKTGWPPGMLQDDSRDLSKWLANRPGARSQAETAAAQIAATTPTTPQPQTQPEPMSDERRLDDGEAWSFCRTVMMDGRDIRQWHPDEGYERQSARIDAQAAKRGDEMMAMVRSHLAARDAELRQAREDMDRIHHALHAVGWHPGRTDDLLTDIIKAKGAELAARDSEVAALREALADLVRNFPTDFDMREAGWSVADIDAACRAYDNARAAIDRAGGKA